jgi:hypothetical protein
VKVCHLVLFAAKAFTSAQLFFSGFNQFSTVHHLVVLGCPLFLVPCVFRSSAAFDMLFAVSSRLLYTCLLVFSFLLRLFDGVSIGKFILMVV